MPWRDISSSSKFNLRDLVRTIAASETYGLSSATVPGNERDTRLFSHQLARPLTAHQMADALAQATDVANRFQGVARRVDRLARPDDGQHDSRYLRPLPAHRDLRVDTRPGPVTASGLAVDRRRA